MSQTELGLDPEMDVVPAELVRVEAGPETEAALEQLALPDLLLLLKFVPPIELKHKADRLATAAMAIHITDKESVEAADAALVEIADVLAEIEKGFDSPTSMAFQLHRRMTGLRADFRANADTALADRKRLIREVTERLRIQAAEALTTAQATADADLKKTLTQAATEAKRGGASPAVVKEMRANARTALAPPVAAPVQLPTRTGSVDTDRWVARFKETPSGAEMNPAMSELTDQQQAQVLEALQLVIDGKMDLSFFEINWKYINKLAGAQKTTFRKAPFEAVNVGSTKVKPRRKPR